MVCVVKTKYISFWINVPVAGKRMLAMGKYMEIDKERGCKRLETGTEIHPLMGKRTVNIYSKLQWIFTDLIPF